MVGAKAIKLSTSTLRADAERALTRSLDASAKVGRDKLARKVSGWQTKVRFTITGTDAVREVTTDNAVFQYQDEGTRPHIIRARRFGRLRFVPRGQSTPVFPRQVNHPGNPAQNFSRDVAEQLEQTDMPRIFEREFRGI